MALASCSLLRCSVLLCHLSWDTSASNWRRTRSLAAASKIRGWWDQNQTASEDQDSQQTPPGHLLWAMHLGQSVGLGNPRGPGMQDQFTENTGKKGLKLDSTPPRPPPPHTNAPWTGLDISVGSLQPQCPGLDTTARVSSRSQKAGGTDRPSGRETGQVLGNHPRP